MTKLDSNGQPIIEDPTAPAAGTEQPRKIMIDGVGEVDEEELKKGYLRQSDYTQKTQALAEERKKIEQVTKAADTPEEVEAARSFLKSEGYLTQAEVDAKIAALKKEQTEAATFDKLVQAYPSLKQHEAAIKAIAKTDDSALEDIIVKYNFLGADKLKKAKERDIVGGGSPVDEKPDVSKMTLAEYQAYKAKHGLGGKKGGFTSAKVRTL